MIEVAKKVGEQGVDFGLDEGYGWLLELLTQGKGGSNADKIAETEQQVKQLRQQVYNFCTSLDQSLAAMSRQIDISTYTNAAALAKLQPLAAMQNYEQNYADVVTHLAAGGALDGNYLQKVYDMRTGLGAVITQFNSLMMDTPDADGLLGLYANVLGDDFGYRPVPTALHLTGATRILPADYVDAAYEQYDVYASAMVRALSLQADVNNLTFTYNGVTFGPDHDDTTAKTTEVVKFLDQWGALMWGGRTTAGQTTSWVAHDLGAVPEGTVADLRVKSQPLLWTTSPAALLGDQDYGHQNYPNDNPTDRTPPPYCGSVSTYCWYQQYDTNRNVIARTSERPSPGDLDTLLTAQGHAGQSGWRVPTTSDWTQLQAGASGGLDVWGRSNRLPMFTATTVNSDLNGVDYPTKLIEPMLINTGSAAAPSYAALSGAATDNTLTLRTLPASTGQALAGRLFLVRDLVAS